MTNMASTPKYGSRCRGEWRVRTMSSLLCRILPHCAFQLMSFNTIRYGYTEESQNRIQEIDRQLSTIQTQSVSLEPYLSKHLSSQSLVSSLSDEDVRVAMIDTSQSVVTSFPPVPGHTKASEEAHTTSADANSHIEKSKDASAKKEKQENVLQKQVTHVFFYCSIYFIVLLA